ncbi:hypothetical protein ABH984_004399 [Bradyrhizobium ottawaense]
MVDPRPVARPPDGMGVAFELVGGLVAHQLEGVASLDQCLTFRRQALQFDGFHLAAVLFALGALLGQFIAVELSFDPVAGAVEDVHRRPEQVLEVGLKTGIGQLHHEGIEDVDDAAGEDSRFREPPGIGLIVEGTVAKELEFLEHLVGWG